MQESASKAVLKAGLSAFAIISVITLSDWSGAMRFASTAAHAESSGGSGSQSGNRGGQGQGTKGSQGGQSNQGGQGSGRAGPGPNSDPKGSQAAGPSSSGSGGGKPFWAQEGIPELELGRLSVVRSPDQVLQRAFVEALNVHRRDSVLSLSLRVPLRRY